MRTYNKNSRCCTFLLLVMKIVNNFPYPVVRILLCFRVTLELKTPFLIVVSNVCSERPFCIKLSVKNFKSFQNRLLGNPAIFCKIYFCKFSQAATLCSIYFLQNMGKLAKKNSAKTNTVKIRSCKN